MLASAGEALLFQSSTKGGQALHAQAGMGFAGRAKIRLDAQMQPEGAASEPAAATRSQMWRFGLLLEAKNITVKAPRRTLAARRHGELDMVQAQDLETSRRHHRNLYRHGARVSGRG